MNRFIYSIVIKGYYAIVLISIAGLLGISCRSPRTYVCGLGVSALQIEQAYFELTPLINRPVIITSKTIAIDSIKSRNLKHCEVVEREINTPESCILLKGNTKFIKQQTAFYDLSQKLVSVNYYAPMGPVSYTYEDMASDRLLSQNMDISLSASFTLSKTRTTVIDNKDTLQITAHWPEQKLLFTRSGKLPTDRVVIYGYE